jgi:flagellar FliL protein
MPPPPKAEAAAAPKAEAIVAAPAAAAAPAARGGLAAWLPAIATLLLAPVATWATVEFVLLPRLQKKILAPATAEAAAAAETHGGEKGKEGKKEVQAYELQNQVVNLAGTMGTRYLKTNVYVVGADPNIKTIFDAAKPKMLDITQSVLGSLTLADIEEPGSKNVIRAKLVEAYNQALNKKVVAEVYLTDFVVQ